ncbi:MAG: RNB domain-containing ribonuclease, partial [Alphaproteobacteria bacterium]|nr:RNB domain-containing ribonuclease [Alphaproteobacteria bacterium]
MLAPNPERAPGAICLAKPPSKSAALPSREDILAFIAREQAQARDEGRGHAFKIGKREIARAFNIKGGQRAMLKDVVRDLKEDGSVTSNRKSLHRRGELPHVVVCDIIKRDHDGELIASPAEWDEEEHGAAPRILILPRKPKPGERAAGIGDRALVRNELDPDAGKSEPAYRGRIIKLLSRAQGRTLGVFRALPNGGGRLIPVDKKQLGRELTIAPGAEGEARDGELVSVELLHEGRFGLPRARVREKLGRIDSEKSISLIALNAHGILHEFRAQTVAEAEAAKPATMKQREDWRALPLLTIDPADAKDHDDAVHAIADDDTANAGGFVITVAIADVSAHVTPGSALDREALERGNSVYFPDRVVPMLPERISNDLCSLRPLQDRPALAVRMVI